MVASNDVSHNGHKNNSLIFIKLHSDIMLPDDDDGARRSRSSCVYCTCSLYEMLFLNCWPKTFTLIYSEIISSKSWANFFFSCADKSHKKWAADTYIISTCKYHASKITLLALFSLPRSPLFRLHWLIFNQTMVVSHQTLYWEYRAYMFN